MKRTGNHARAVSFLAAIALAGMVPGSSMLEASPRASDTARPESGVTTLYSNAYSGFEERARLVIRDVDTWNRIWPRIAGPVSPMPPPPEVDFSRHMVLVAAMGMRSSGGHDIVIEGRSEHDDGIHVRVREISPGSSCFVTLAIVHPVTVAAVPRSDAPVVWEETSRIRRC